MALRRNQITCRGGYIWIYFGSGSTVLTNCLLFLLWPFPLPSRPQALTNAVTVWARRRSGVRLHLPLRSSLSETAPTRWTRSPPCPSSGTSTKTWPGRWRWASPSVCCSCFVLGSSFCELTAAPGCCRKASGTHTSGRGVWKALWRFVSDFVTIQHFVSVSVPGLLSCTTEYWDHSKKNKNICITRIKSNYENKNI